MIEKSEKIKGKTYSLFGNTDSTMGFYEFINYTLDGLLQNYKDERILLEVIKTSCKKKKSYDKFIEENIFLKESLHVFASYVSGVTEHISGISIFKILKSDLKTKEWQYHLYMLEFALTNRIYREKFLKCDVKIALLPHCLRDLKKTCKAEMNGFDYQCRHCSKDCFINESSRILTEQNIEPYIWMSSDFKKMAKKNFVQKKTLGVLGIACILQLVRGMRMCTEKNIPAIGLPLDANRCVRWMGDFYPNSINIEILKNII